MTAFVIGMAEGCVLGVLVFVLGGLRGWSFWRVMLMTFGLIALTYGAVAVAVAVVLS